MKVLRMWKSSLLRLEGRVRVGDSSMVPRMLRGVSVGSCYVDVGSWTRAEHSSLWLSGICKRNIVAAETDWGCC